MGHLQKKTKQTQKQARWISPSNKSLVTMSSVKCAFFELFDYAVTQSYAKIKEYMYEDFSMTDIFNNHFGLLRFIFRNKTLETTNHWLMGYH